MFELGQRAAKLSCEIVVVLFLLECISTADDLGKSQVWSVKDVLPGPKLPPPPGRSLQGENTGKHFRSDNCPGHGISMEFATAGLVLDARDQTL
jgi:hypothetical protein